MPIPCPLGCGEVIDEREAQTHFETRCPRVSIACPYGCQQRFRREQLGEHGTTCPVITQFKPGNSPIIMADSSSITENKNAFDAFGNWVKALFTRQRSPNAADPVIAVQVDGELGGKAGAAVVSAVPARMKGESSSSAPPSPGLKRSKDGSKDAALSVPSPTHQRVLSAPSPPRGSLQGSGSQQNIFGSSAPPPIFAFLVPLVEQYSPAVVPYLDRAQDLYAEFLDSDQKSHYVYHIIIGLTLLYLLSSLMLFVFKLFVFSVLMFSTGWTVHTSDWFNSNEALKRYAFGAVAFIGVYLFALMH